MQFKNKPTLFVQRFTFLDFFRTFECFDLYSTVSPTVAAAWCWLVDRFMPLYHASSDLSFSRILSFTAIPSLLLSLSLSLSLSLFFFQRVLRLLLITLDRLHVFQTLSFNVATHRHEDATMYFNITHITGQNSSVSRYSQVRSIILNFSWDWLLLARYF